MFWCSSNGMPTSQQCRTRLFNANGRIYFYIPTEPSTSWFIAAFVHGHELRCQDAAPTAITPLNYSIWIDSCDM